MDFVNLNEKISEAQKQNKRMTRLFGTDSFRSWMLCFKPGDGTDMHYHASPETFLVLEGRASVKGLTGEERFIEKNELVFLNPKDYYQITNVGAGPLVLLGNRSEGFGGPHVTFKEDKSE
jgi:mannose-6-phosphate isomerase-like protein (cupin superfamily)